MNRIKGVIRDIESDDFLSIIKVEAEIAPVYVLLLETPETATYLKRGKEVNIIFKETEVEIVKDCSSEYNSFLNRFEGTVESFEIGCVIAKIIFKVGDVKIFSIIPKKSFDSLKLEKGEKVSLIVRATEISLEVL